jgi:hypothetical protein
MRLPALVLLLLLDHQRSVHFADPEQVAYDIVRSLERCSPDILYTPRIWRHIMTAVKLVPETIFKRLPL